MSLPAHTVAILAQAHKTNSTRACGAVLQQHVRRRACVRARVRACVPASARGGGGAVGIVRAAHTYACTHVHVTTYPPEDLYTCTRVHSYICTSVTCTFVHIYTRNLHACNRMMHERPTAGRRPTERRAARGTS